MFCSLIEKRDIVDTLTHASCLSATTEPNKAAFLHHGREPKGVSTGDLCVGMTLIFLVWAFLGVFGVGRRPGVLPGPSALGFQRLAFPSPSEVV